MRWCRWFIIVFLFSVAFTLFSSRAYAAACGSNTANVTCKEAQEGAECKNNAMDGGDGVCYITDTATNFCTCLPKTGIPAPPPAEPGAPPTSSQPPAPGAPTAPTTSTSGNKRCGINIDPANPAGFPGGDKMKGIGWARLVFKSTGGYAAYDPVVNSLNAAGVKVLMVVNHETYWGDGTNSWDGGNFDQYAQSFGAKVGEIASHYGPKVAAYEIWNEPDGVGTQFAHLDPIQLGKVGSAAIPAIHRAGAKAVLGGFVGGEGQIADYVRQMQAAVSLADAISGHPYGKQPNSSEFHNYLNTVTGFGKPFWITEFSTGNTDNGQASADFMKGMYEDLNTNYGTKVPVTIWFAWSDNMEAAGTSFGITNRSGEPKQPIYDTFFKDACSATVPSAKVNTKSIYIYPGIEEEKTSPEQLKRASEYMLTCAPRLTFIGHIYNVDKINIPSDNFIPIPLDCSGPSSCLIPNVSGFAYVNHEQTTIPLFRFQNALTPNTTSSDRRLDDWEGFFSAKYQGGADTFTNFVGNGTSTNLLSTQASCQTTLDYLKAIKNLCENETPATVAINNKELIEPQAPPTTPGTPPLKCALDLTLPQSSDSYLDILKSQPSGFSCGQDLSTLDTNTAKSYQDFRNKLSQIETTTPKAFKPAYIVHYVDQPAEDPTVFDKIENWLSPQGSTQEEKLSNRVKVTKVYVPAGFAESTTDSPPLVDKTISANFTGGFMSTMYALTPQETTNQIKEKIKAQADEIFSKSSASNMTNPDPYLDKFLSCPECDQESFISILVKRINAEAIRAGDLGDENMDCFETDAVGEKADTRKQIINPDGTLDPVREISMPARATLKAMGSIGKKVSLRTYLLLPQEYKNVFEYEKVLASALFPPGYADSLNFTLKAQPNATDGGKPAYKYLQMSDTAPKFGRAGKTVHMSSDEVEGQIIGYQTNATPPEVKLKGRIESADTSTFDINPLTPGGRLARGLWELVCHAVQPPAETQYAPYGGFEKILTQGSSACFVTGAPICKESSEKPTLTKIGNGYLVTASIHAKLMTTTSPSEYGQKTCEWAGKVAGGPPTYSINANFGNSATDPIGPFGSDGKITNAPIKPGTDVMSLMIDKSGTAHVYDWHKRSQTPDIQGQPDLSQANFIVTGVFYDNFQGAYAGALPRTAIGLKGEKLYLRSLVATPEGVKQAMADLGIDDGHFVMLDGDSVSQLCEGTTLVYPVGENYTRSNYPFAVSVSMGVSAGDGAGATCTPVAQTPPGSQNGMCIEVFPAADKVTQFATQLTQTLPGQSGLWNAYFPERTYEPLKGPQHLFLNSCTQGFCYNSIINQAVSVGVNPYLAIAIALNEDGGLRSDQPDHTNIKHFGCDPFGKTPYSEPSTIENKLKCMINTLTGNKSKTSNEILTTYGYIDGYNNSDLAQIIDLLSNKTYQGICQ